MNPSRIIAAAAASTLCAALLCGCSTASEQTESTGSGAFDRYEIPETGTQPPTEVPTTQPPTTAPPVTEPATTTAARLSIGIQIGGEKTDPPADSRMGAFRSAVEKIYYAGIYPDGSDCGVDGFGQTSDILFALFDIDEDGEKELIVQNTTACMAAMVEYIFDADASGNITEEFIAFPSAEYYSGGYMTCGISHNQGLAGSFWPYSLCKYNPATDTYESVGFVDAWDGTCFETGYDGEPFPAEADTSNSGIVYYITQDGVTTGPMDVTEYEAWYNSHMAGRTMIDIPFMNITEANIADVFG